MFVLEPNPRCDVKPQRPLIIKTPLDHLTTVNLQGTSLGTADENIVQQQYHRNKYNKYM